MVSFQIKAEKREKFGSSEARRIKKSGNTPAIILSKAGNLNITLNSKDFEVEFKKGNIQSKVIEIEIDGRKIKSIAKDIELDPVSDKIIHVDFINIEDGEKVRAWPKVEVLNSDKSPGIKKGGFLNKRLRKVEVICDNVDQIPESIQIDVAKLQVGGKIRKDDINPGEGIKFATSRNFLFLSITGRGKSASDDAAADDAAAVAAAGDAAAKKEADGAKK